MMIKNKFNFFVGIFCAVCFVVNVVNGRDSFTLGLSACAAIINLIIAFIDER